MTEEQLEDLKAAMYNLKTSSNEIEVKEAAKLILNNHMDMNGLRTILSQHHVGILTGKTSVEQDKATDVAFASFSNVIAELFVNAFRMGMLEQQNDYRKLIKDIQDNKGLEVIGTPAEESESEKKAEEE